MKKIFLIIVFCFSVVCVNAQFTTGNIVVLEVGDGVTPLSSAGNPIALREYTSAGVPGITVNIPSTGPGQHVISGSATSEGLISLSSDQTKIIIPGYAAPAGTASIAGTTSAAFNRAISSVDGAGNYTQNVLSSTFFSANNIRGAASDGVGNFWATGANTGYLYFGTGTPANVSATSTNNRATAIIAGSITFSSGAGTRGIYQIPGTPTTGPTTATLVVPTGGSSSPFQYAADFVNGVVYVADDRATGSGGGIQKWVFAGTWNLAYTFDCGSGFGARGLVVDFSGPNPILYATTTEGSPTSNRLIKFTDAGAPSAFTLLATSPANKTFRGLAFSPTFVPPPTPTVSLSLSTTSGSEAGTTVVRVLATSSSVVGSTQTVSVGVSGAGITAGDYTLSNTTITINAGFDTASVKFTVVDDAVFEGTETVTISISSPSSGLTLGSPTSGNVTITDNDLGPAPTVHFTALHQSVLENSGTANVGFTMTTSPNASPCRIVVTTSVHTTALGGGIDYTIANDTVTFPAGTSTAQNLVVNINDDAISENAEYVSFKVSTIINGTLGSNQYHILYIRDNDYTPPTATNEVMLQLLTSYSNGTEGTNSAEIVVYDSSSQKLVIANSIGAKLDIVNFTNPSAPGPINSINILPLGNINSVAVRNGIIAVALENSAPQSNGKVLFYNMSGTLISQVDVGAMPDMITFNHAGNKVYTVCEGEPNSAYTLDPEGTIAVVDISGGVASVTNANVTIINFNAYNGQEALLRSQGIRIFGNNGTATASQDFEPEYIAISNDDQKAWVTLQENNAMVILNLSNNTITQVVALGSIDHTNILNGLDASDQTSGINIANYPVKGLYMPDAITQMNIGGTNYIFTANEGDAREYGGVNNEQVRISSLNLDPTVFPDQNILKSNFMLGRLRATNKLGDTNGDADFDEIYVYGGRGFSVWDENGALLYNSGNLLEKIIANNPSFVSLFNLNNDNSAPVAKDRSDDKGPEIEGVTVANIDGDNILFASAERMGGVFLFNIDNPVSPRYIGYYNNRTIGPNGPDRGAEGIIYIPASASPNGNDLVILANEVSSTLSIFQINTCAALSNVDVNFTPNDTICAGSNVTFSTTVGANTNLQWLMNNANIVGETGTSTMVNTSGNYSLAVQNTALLCSDTTAQTQIVVNSLPTISGNVTDNDFCNGTSVTFTGTGGTSYTWTGGVTNGVAIAPSSSGTYTVTGTGANSCTNTSTVNITVHALPTVGANVTDNDFCIGTNVTFTGTGASSYTWNGGVMNGVPTAPASSATYTVTGTDAFTCSNTATVSVTVHTLPTVAGNVTDNDICAGTSVTFTGSGATSYNWSSSVINGTAYTPLATNTYTVTGTDASSCSNTATVTVTVHNLPSVVANITDNDICTGTSVTFTGNGAASYVWSSPVVNGTPIIPSGTATYTVTGTDASTCSNTATITVTVHNLPTVTGNVTDNVICLGEGVVFTGSGASSYTWTSGVTNGSSYTPSATATYTVTGTDASSCSNTGTITVTVNNLPSVTLNITPDIYCLTNSTFAIPGASPAGGIFSGTGVTGSSFDPSTGIGVYTITYTYTDANGCTAIDNDDILVNPCLDITNEETQNISIYPNPTEDVFFIKSSTGNMYSMTIIDMHGKTVIANTVSDSDMIDISTLSSGVYIVELKSNDVIYRARMIKK